MTDTEIIRALRLCSCEASTRGCPTCPLSGNDDCVTDALRVAADLIERLTAENVVLPDGQTSAIESLRKEIEWKDMVIALAQKEQAKAEAERDALLGELRKIGCTYCKYVTMCVDELSVIGQEDCDRCGKRETCVCLTCSGYGSETDKWQWRGLPEAPEDTQ